MDNAAPVELINRFLSEKFSHSKFMSFGYGSGVLPQKNSTMNDKMIDLILIVDDPIDFHRKNIKANGNHYSIVKYYPLKYINFIFHRISSGVYFNPYIPFQGRMFKYGIVSTEKFYKDLECWLYLYLAGRLHKPVLWLNHDSLPTECLSLLALNLRYAFTAALLMLPEEISELKFYYTICNFSYFGDVRRLMRLDTKKHIDITDENLERLRVMYKPCFEQYSDICSLDNGTVRCSHSQTSIDFLSGKTPPLLSNHFGSIRQDGALVTENYIKSKIISYIFFTNILSSSTQTYTNFYSAGLVKSAKYIGSKILRSIK